MAIHSCTLILLQQASSNVTFPFSFGSHQSRKVNVNKTDGESFSEKGSMAREQQQIVAEEPLRKRKSVRFGECPDPGSSGGPVGVVPSLVPHLPGLDPDALYVISGPFPQYDEGSGISNMVR